MVTIPLPNPMGTSCECLWLPLPLYCTVTEHHPVFCLSDTLTAPIKELALFNCGIYLIYFCSVALL